MVPQGPSTIRVPGGRRPGFIDWQPIGSWTIRLLMRRFAKFTLLVLVLALLVVGLPIGMPMGTVAMCPQCVLPTGLACMLAVVLGFGLVAPQRPAGRAGWLPVRLRARLCACAIEHPPQALPSLP
jgi:hypothetical protein